MHSTILTNLLHPGAAQYGFCISWSHMGTPFSDLPPPPPTPPHIEKLNILLLTSPSTLYPEPDQWTTQFNIQHVAVTSCSYMPVWNLTVIA